MRYSFLISAIAVGSSLVCASPIDKREEYAVDFNPPPGGDITILNYALTLEYLERKFYTEGLEKFTQKDFIDAGFPDPFYKNLKEVLIDEQVHVSTLAGALGPAAVKEAQYKFPYKDVQTFVALASVLEGVGVSAYLGATASIMKKSYLTIAGSILTVESKHSSYIRAALKESPIPKPFDTPLDFNAVYSLAAQFITSFAPGAAPLPFKAFPPIELRISQYAYTAGSSSVTFTHAKGNAINAGLIKEDTPVYAVFFSGLDTYYVAVRETGGNGRDFKLDHLPGAADGKLAPVGQVYVVLSTADGKTTTIKDDNTISGVGFLEILPVGVRA